MESQTNVMEYLCPCCGARLSFDGQSQLLQCEYCDNTFDIDAVRAFNEKELGKAATATGKAGPARYKRTKLKPGQTPTERVSGFRIQIYQGTGAEGNANAKKMQTRARQAFPGISTYVSLNGPRWVCRIGDFQTNEEAQIFLRRVRSSGISKTVSIVRSSIFVTY